MSKHVELRSSPDETGMGWPPIIHRVLGRLREAARGEEPVLVFLGSMFVARWFLAPWNSYWLDELLSVNVYGHWHPTAFESLRALADASVHPPLYQFTLYHWISLFGDSEQATRSLSNLYITLGSLFVYLLVRDAFSRRLAFLSVIGFALMYTPTYYALETRSYAQTMFLVALSSYLLFRILHAYREAPRWRTPQVVVPLVLFAGANTAAIMTHYYNLFWLAAQGVFVVVYLLREGGRSSWRRSLGVIVAGFVTPLVLFLGTWGSIFVRQLREDSGGYEIETDSPEMSPWELLSDLVISRNLRAGVVVAWILGLLVLGVVLRSAVNAVRSVGTPRSRDRAWTILYLAVWLVLPLAITYFAFSLLEVERYRDRYFVYCVVPLAPLLIIAADQGVAAVASRARRLPATLMSTTLSAALIVLLILPLGRDAATERKHDWRGNVERIIDIIEEDEDNSYIVWEASNRRRPMTDFYFERLGSSGRPYGTMPRHEERRGEYQILDEGKEAIAGHDRLILLFAHNRVDHFPNALDELEDRYKVRHRQLDRRGRGFIVFDVDSE